MPSGIIAWGAYIFTELYFLTGIFFWYSQR